MSNHAKFSKVLFWFIALSFSADIYKLFIAHAYNVQIDWETVNVLRGTYSGIYDISILGILFMLISNIADTITRRLLLIGFLFFMFLNLLIIFLLEPHIYGDLKWLIRCIEMIRELAIIGLLFVLFKECPFENQKIKYAWLALNIYNALVFLRITFWKFFLPVDCPISLSCDILASISPSSGFSLRTVGMDRVMIDCASYSLKSALINVSGKSKPASR